MKEEADILSDCEIEFGEHLQHSGCVVWFKRKVKIIICCPSRRALNKNLSRFMATIKQNLKVSTNYLLSPEVRVLLHGRYFNSIDFLLLVWSLLLRFDLEQKRSNIIHMDYITFTGKSSYMLDSQTWDLTGVWPWNNTKNQILPSNKNFELTFLLCSDVFPGCAYLDNLLPC